MLSQVITAGDHVLLGARVFAAFEQDFGLVAPRDGERACTILAACRKGRWSSFLAAVEALAQFRNREIRRGALGLAIPAKIPAKWAAAVGFCLDFQSVATVFRGNSESN